MIEDNFLEEDDDDIENSIRASRESGEIDPRLWKWLYKSLIDELINQI